MDAGRRAQRNTEVSQSAYRAGRAYLLHILLGVDTEKFFLKPLRNRQCQHNEYQDTYIPCR